MVFGTVKLINAFIPSMRVQQSGDIVVVGSRMAWHAATPVRRTYTVISRKLIVLIRTNIVDEW